MCICPAHVTRFLDFGQQTWVCSWRLNSDISQGLVPIWPTMRKMNNYTLRPLTLWAALPLCNMTETIRFEQHLLFKWRIALGAFQYVFYRLQMCHLLVWLPPTPMAGFSYRLSLGFWFGFSLRISNGFWLTPLCLLPTRSNQSCILERCPVYYNYTTTTATSPTTSTTLSCQKLPPPTVQASASQAINTRLAMRACSQQNQLSEAAISWNWVLEHKMQNNNMSLSTTSPRFSLLFAV